MSGSRRPLPSTAVTLLTDPPQKTTTDSLGAFTFAGVAPGTYLLLTRRIGVEPRNDTLHLTHARAAAFELPLDGLVLDGPCSGYMKVRVRKGWRMPW